MLPTPPARAAHPVRRAGRLLRIATLTLGFAALPLPATAQEPGEPGEPAAALDPVAAVRDAVVEHRLENGWLLLLLPRPGPPMVAFETAIDVGAIDEPLGLSGLAHMFEHMAFKGSDRLGTLDWEAERAAIEAVDARYTEWRAARGEERAEALEALRAAQEEAARYVIPEAFSAVLESAGGTALNASTSADTTRYTVTLPANRLELWAWLEVERFDRLVLREFYRERDAVIEERNLRVDANPIGTLIEQLGLIAIQAHPYRRPVIGFESDIRAYTRESAQAFFERHYGGRRLTSALVGSFDPAQALPLLERHLSRLAPGPEPRRVVTQEPLQRGERRAVVRFPAQPLLALAWHVPERAHPESPAVDLAMRVLGEARSSRLERRLVLEEGLAAGLFVGTGFPGERFGNLAYVVAVPNEGVELEVLEAAIHAEIALLVAEGPRAAELEAVRTAARAAFLRELRDPEAVAQGLTTAAIEEGDWRAYFEQPERLASVEIADVQRVLARWFVADNRTVLSLLPPLPEPDPATPPADQAR